MKPVKIYTTSWCPYCVRAKRLLDKKGISYEEVDVESDDETRARLVQQTGRRTVPQIFIGEHHVGGEGAQGKSGYGRRRGVVPEGPFHARHLARPPVPPRRYGCYAGMDAASLACRPLRRRLHRAALAGRAGAARSRSLAARRRA